MAASRLSPFDRSFLDVETDASHMHVGWVARFRQPDAGPVGFEAISKHLVTRLGRAPRYRQRLARVPFELHDPVWVDDDRFDPAHHVRHAPGGDFAQIIGRVLSEPLARDRPLWEIHIADGLDDGSIGMVGKAHHCMVDGVAAVELVSLLLDQTPAPPPAEPDQWRPAALPAPAARLIEAAVDRTREGIAFAGGSARFALSPWRWPAIPGAAVSVGRTLAGAVLPPAPPSLLNTVSSPLRSLSRMRRPLSDLRDIKGQLGGTVNDVILAAAAGALRAFALERDEPARPLKAMVPVNVRVPEEDGGLGNRISFVFVELPCDEPDPARRLEIVRRQMDSRKAAGDPERTDGLLDAVGRAPIPVQRAVAAAMSSPRMFNLVVSNLSGPPGRVYMAGCELLEAYPVVPLTEGHSLSIGMLSVQGDACFGLYTDERSLPDAGRLKTHLDAALDELLALAGRG
jgi:diacylglycerol O-acyltransferase / wax synthase